MKKTTVVVTVLVMLLSTAASLCAAEKKVLARIGDMEITEEYFKGVVDGIPEMYKKQVATLEGRKNLLNRIVELKVVAVEARRQGLDKTQAVLDNIDQMLSRIYMNNLKDSVEVAEDEIRKFYDENKENYFQKEQVKASHILVKTEEEAKAVLEELKGGKEFGEIAVAKSVCPSKAKAGDLGWFERGRMVPEFEKVAFELKKDEISGVVKSQFGYHVIKTTDKKDGYQKDLAEVTGEIRQRLEQEKLGKLIQSTVERLKKEQKVEIMEDKVE